MEGGQLGQKPSFGAVVDREESEEPWLQMRLLDITSCFPGVAPNSRDEDPKFQGSGVSCLQPHTY